MSGQHTKHQNSHEDSHDKLRALEIKVNDHDQKFKLILGGGRRSLGGGMGPRSFVGNASGSKVLSHNGDEIM